MRAILIFLSLNLSIVISAAAQSYIFKGTVKNVHGSPVPNVTVQVLNYSVAVNTDNKGHFILRAPVKTIEVVFSHVGYATAIITIKESDDPVTISLTSAGKQLSEVVVVANQKEEQLLKAPVAVSVLSAEKLRQLKVWNMDDLTGIVPNYKYADLGVSYQSQIAIRGISIFSETPATATYIDGVAALDVAGTGLQLLNIERVEILRGPQGTLYGRNAIGGVINITTKRPNNHTSGFAEVSAGNQGLQRYGAGLNSPLVKGKLFINAAGQYEKKRGFYTNDLSNATVFNAETKERYSLKGSPEDGVRVGDEESYYASLSLKYIPSSRWQLSLNNIFQEQHSVGASSYYMAVPTNIIAVNDPYKFTVNDLGSHQRKYFSSSLSGTYYHSAYTITSTTALQHILQGYHHIDQDLLPDNAAYGSSYRKKIGNPYPQTVFSEELRIQSNERKKLKWTAGIYYFNQQFDKQYAAVYKDLALLLGMQPGTQITKTNFGNWGAAAYAQARYQVSPQLEITAGFRADYEDRIIDVGRYYLSDNDIRNYDIKDTTKQSNYSALSPKFVLQHALNSNQYLYASFSRGFRAGGNNLFTKDKYISYNPEYSNNYEIGYKAELWEKKLRISTALFYLYWKDMQLDLNPEPGVWIVDNVGNVTSYGAEAELTVVPFLGMQADLSIGYNNAHYGNFDYLGKNRKGNQAIMAPEYTGMFALQQFIPVSKKIVSLVRLDWRRIGNQYFDLANEVRQPAYNLLNGRISFNYKKTELAFWAQNITDERYLTFAMPGYFKHSIINRPRTLGITLRHLF